MTVYRATNTVNGKVYVGKTTKDLTVRWKWHLSEARSGSSLYFHRAIRKHGASAFIVESIATASTKEELSAGEIASIAVHNSADSKYGYNQTHGGEGGALNADARKKLSDSCKGRTFSAVTRAKMSAARRGTAAWNKGLKLGPSPKRGIRLSPETRAKIKSARAIQTINQIKKRIQYKKISVSLMDHKHSEETLQKLSERAKEGYANGRKNPMTGVPSPMKGVRHTPEALAKIRKAKREYWARIRAEKGKVI